MPEDVFRLHPRIRWVGFATEKGAIAFLKMRPGIDGPAPEEGDHFLAQFAELIVNGICQRSGLEFDRCEYTIICYEKMTELVMYLKKGILALTVDKSVPYQEILELTKSVQTIMT